MCEPYTEIWPFATALYRQADIEPLCLELQQAHQVNVSLLIWLVWAETYFKLDGQTAEAGSELANLWQQALTGPLRSARTWMKQGLAMTEREQALREEIKACELRAEKHLLLRLQDLTGRCRPDADGTYGETRRYLQSKCGSLSFSRHAFDILQRAVPLI